MNSRDRLVASTQVSLLPPPCCIEATRLSSDERDARQAARHHGVRSPQRDAGKLASTKWRGCQAPPSSHTGTMSERDLLLRDIIGGSATDLLASFSRWRALSSRAKDGLVRDGPGRSA